MKIFKSQRGFTLVEMLVAVAIMAIVAGVAVPLVTGVTASSKTKADNAELVNIQAAVDTMMAANDVSVLTASPSATTDMGAVQVTPLNGTPVPLYPNFLRSPASTSRTYSFSTTGAVTTP